MRQFISFTYTDEDENTYRLRGTYRPADPGRISGPPENCYPPEPADFSLHEIFDPKTKIPFDHSLEWWEKNESAILEAAQEAYDNSHHD